MEHVREIAKRVIEEMEANADRHIAHRAARIALIDYRLALQNRGSFGDAYVSRDLAVKAGADDNELEEKCYRLRQLWAAGKLGGRP